MCTKLGGKESGERYRMLLRSILDRIFASQLSRSSAGGGSRLCTDGMKKALKSLLWNSRRALCVTLETTISRSTQVT